MSDDAFARSLHDLNRARGVLQSELSKLDGGIKKALAMRARGVGVLAIMRALDGPKVRESILRSVTNFLSAFAAARSVAVSTLVRLEGMTHSDIARESGLSRQAISRLYAVTTASMRRVVDDLLD
jgi:hypothetical protein